MIEKEGGWKIAFPERQFLCDKPLVTIITVVFNSVSFFEETI